MAEEKISNLEKRLADTEAAKGEAEQKSDATAKEITSLRAALKTAQEAAERDASNIAEKHA
jgi:hypothetical protein